MSWWPDGRRSDVRLATRGSERAWQDERRSRRDRTEGDDDAGVGDDLPLNYGIGMSDRNGFRVFELSNPARLVIDVAHDLPAPTSTELQSSPTGDDRNAGLTAIRTGAHPSYDRVVFDFSG